MIILRRTTHFANLLTLLLIFCSLSDVTLCVAATERTSRTEYIDRYRHIAIEHHERYGIPASITMAQGILESDSGNSNLSTKSNNHFGIKCKSNWTGRTVKHDDDELQECFRAYDKVEHSYEDHAKFLDESPRYNSLFDLSSTDYRGWATGLKRAGYATAPDYAERLVKIIEDNKLYLLDEEAENGVKAYDAMVAMRGGDTKSTQQPRSGGVVDPNNYQVPISSHNGYSIFRVNQSRYLIAKEGDSYGEVSKQFGLSKRAVTKYNDLADSDTKLEKGTMVYIEPKQKRWHGNTHSHIALEGETMGSIAQEYAIRLKSLYKLNSMRPNEEPTAGDKILLR